MDSDQDGSLVEFLFHSGAVLFRNSDVCERAAAAGEAPYHSSNCGAAKH